MWEPLAKKYILVGQNNLSTCCLAESRNLIMSFFNAKQVITDLYKKGERDFRGFRGQLRGADLSGMDLQECNFSGLDLSEIVFSKSILTKSNFTDANLSFTDIDSAQITQAILRNTNLECANITNSDVRFCIFERANLSGVNFWNSRLDPSIFSGAVFDAETVFPTGFKQSTKGMRILSD